MDNQEGSGRLIIFSAPSGAGKTTIVKALLRQGMKLFFSVSATTRPPRSGEEHGREYYFLSDQEFKKHIDEGSFIEYEEVYQGYLYGTLKQDVDKHLIAGHHVVFDIDVKGGLTIKKVYGDQALSIFIMPPDIKALEYRLKARGTETGESLQKRMEKASWELTQAKYFDLIIVNDNLEQAIKEVKEQVMVFISK